jgi:rare lipoprotein A
MIAACGASLGATVNRSAFTSSEYGVGVSPRVTSDPYPARGGGRYQVGRPYTVRGKTYVPQEDPNYVATGEASWYGADFHGRRTANGEIFSANHITGAHPTLPLPSYVRVTNQANGRSVIVRVNDRGPYMPGRIMDLSYRAATMLGYVNNGHAQIRAEYVGPAPLEGDDTRMLVASYSGPADFGGNTQFADAGGTNSVADIAGNFIGSIFSYADPTSTGPGADIASAHDAANAMASSNPELSQSNQMVDAGGSDVQIGLGSYADPQEAIAVSQQFALLGAVLEQQSSVGGTAATTLTLTHLKPGAAKVDVFNLAQELGLTGIVEY